MICRYYREGQKLNVADLNEIIVLIDRTEAELTEVALNTWPPGLDGPPHFHNEKDQIFYITSGKGTVVLGGERFSVEPGHLVYVPSGLKHQTITVGDEPLCYMLFNFFLDRDKEGHATFADHIEKVKLIRKQQAESGQAELDESDKSVSSGRIAIHVADINAGKRYEFGSNITRLLIDRPQTARCEAVIVTWPKGNRGAMVSHKEKEQTFFVLSGSGMVTVGDETSEVKPGNVVFIPWQAPHTTEAINEDLSYLCLNTYISDPQDKSFEEMYNRIAPQRKKRWRSGSQEVGD